MRLVNSMNYDGKGKYRMINNRHFFFEEEERVGAGRFPKRQWPLW